jgi:hypothetical protein
MSGQPVSVSIPNGSGAAAILSAAIGCLAHGCFALASDALPQVQSAFSFWPPTGALSGVSTTAILVWLATWESLRRRWKTRDVSMISINIAAVGMLTLALLLTFPPFMDLVQGKS